MFDSLVEFLPLIPEDVLVTIYPGPVTKTYLQKDQTSRIDVLMLSQYQHNINSWFLGNYVTVLSIQIVLIHDGESSFCFLCICLQFSLPKIAKLDAVARSVACSILFSTIHALIFVHEDVRVSHVPVANKLRVRLL